ncbi:leucyl-tRNA synthetase [Colletotrichum tofieldiae]|nr:leucyl-tRNA synthetase [Colletotrichum tofieldiae]GKT81623.1 leucyl-tRNA synthetase [Colletotrichum tofieldiae]GKT97598.1 leucyl-tRNA synthetase [Colletotrichum tofieldiae]
MSKSTGNFLTLRQTVENVGTDAARITIADAGDAVEDANLEKRVANKTILKLYELKKWLKEMLYSVVLIESPDDFVCKRDDNEVVNVNMVQRTGAFNLRDELLKN